jgi:hypothetical protein
LPPKILKISEFPDPFHWIKTFRNPPALPSPRPRPDSAPPRRPTRSLQFGDVSAVRRDSPAARPALCRRPYADPNRPADDRTGINRVPPISSANLPPQMTVRDFGTRFRIRFTEGQKTGFFRDERENGQQLASYCEGRSVLELCCCSGGFAIQAKKLGNAGDSPRRPLPRTPQILAKTNAAPGHLVVLNRLETEYLPAVWMRLDSLSTSFPFTGAQAHVTKLAN